MDKKQLQSEIERHLMIFYPKEYLAKYVTSARDIYENRYYLRELPYGDFTVSYLSDLLLKAIVERKKFRTLDCLKVLRFIVKDQVSPNLNTQSVSKLFKLYRNYIFVEREEVQWCVSALVKDRELKEEEINWLISNYKKSEHLVNRLLRYPKQNILIAEWAKKVYQQGEIKKRKSELLGLLIDDKIPSIARSAKKQTLVWAVYYSRIRDDIKILHLKKLFDEECTESIIEVSMRLGYPAVLQYVLSQIKKNA